MTTINGIKRFFARPARLGLMAAAGLMAGGALAAGFDGKTLVTNAWFDASFTSLAVDTTIVTNTTTGITFGAGTWTSAPTNGTAKIVADEDAGSGATMLAIDAPDEELTFTPAALATATGMATVTVNMKTIAVDTLPAPEGDAQGAFAIYSTNGVDHSLAAYVSDGADGVWTNLVYASAADLTNAWFALTLDFATVSNVRYVRYSITPSSGSLTILADSEGTQWFRSADDDATTVASVSFTGTGNIRTFSGKELQEAVANYNGENYATVADAIAAAEENGTVTLVKAVTEDVLTISENITLDFNGKAASLGGIVINEGKTLTVTKANSNNNVIPTITGGGNLVVSGNNTFAWKGMAGTSSLATISQNDSGSGGIAITGHGTINVTGDVNVKAALTFSPSSAEAAYVSDGFTIKMAANSVSAGTLNGGATIETEEGTTVGGGTFYGVVNGGLSASGDFISQGAGMNGKVAIAGGKTLTIGNRLASMSNIRFHLDATDSATYTLEDETSNLTQIKGGDNTYSLESGSAAAVLNAGDVNHFGGRPYFQFDGSKYARGNKVCAKSYIAVTHPDALGGYLAYYSDQDRFGTSSTAWFARCYGNSRDGWLTQNGTTDRSATAGVDTIIALLTRITASDNREDHLGTSYVGAIAEFVGFYSAISVEDRVACEMYLMDKWNLAAAANFRPFVSTAEVELDTGATLDLGGYTQTVKSISGSGTVQNGTLTVTDAISVGAGKTLVIPYGSSYTLADDGTFAVVDSVGGTVTITHYAAAIDGTPYDSVREAILAYTSGTLTIYDSATDIDLGTADVNITGVVLASDVSAPTFAANLQYTASYSSGTISNVRNAKTYVWNGAVDTAWSTLGNWQIGDDEPLLVPAAGDTISFASAATVTAVPASTTVSAITMGSNIGTVTIAGEPLTISTAISVTAGNTLMIPYGSTYTLADGTGEMVDTTAGTVTLKHKAATITADDVTMVYDTVKGAILAYSSGTLTIYENATDIDLGTTDYTVGTVVLADDVDAPTFVANAPYVAKYENGAISNVRVASTYTWTPTGSSTDWNTLSNWRIGTATPVVAAGNSDTVVFPALEEETEAHKITVTSANVASVIINGDVEITGAIQYTRNSSSGNSIIYTTSVTGTGKATLGNNAGFGSSTKGSSLSIDVPLVVTASKETPAAIQGYWKRNGGLSDCSSATITGAITGTGYICFSGNRFSCSVTGSVADFEGTIEITGDSLERNTTTFADVSSKAKYYITNNNGDDNSFITNYAADLSFRELSGSPTSTKIHGDTTYTWEVGSGNTSFTLNGQYHKTGDANSYNDKLLDGGIVIKKVGTGIMDFGGTWIHGLEIAAGTVHLRSSSMLTQKTRNHTYVTPISFTGGILQVGYTTVNHDTEYEEDGETVKTEAYTEYVPFDPSANILNSTSQIVFDDQGTNCTWATPLASSNKGGFVKKGAGTLTLKAIPLCEGATTVEDGTLVVDAGAAWTSYTLGANTKVTVEGTTYTFTALTADELPTPDAEDENQLDVPESMTGKTAAYAIEPGQTLDCSALTEASGITAVVTTTVGGTKIDMTDYYTSTSLGVNSSGVIEPELADSVKPTVVTDGSDAPMELTTSTVSFNVSNFKKGLYYGISVGTSPDGLKCEAPLQQATDDSGTGVDLSSGMPGIGVKYYRIVVSDVPLAAE